MLLEKLNQTFINLDRYKFKLFVNIDLVEFVELDDDFHGNSREGQQRRKVTLRDSYRSFNYKIVFNIYHAIFMFTIVGGAKETHF